MVWRWYVYSCPICRKTYQRSLSPFQLGSGKRRCPNCTSVFDDGTKEWPELPPMEKFEYVCPTMVLDYFGGTATVIGYAFFMAADSRELNLMLGVFIALHGFALDTVFSFAKRCRQVFQGAFCSPPVARRRPGCNIASLR
jgi:hypothetical protein